MDREIALQTYPGIDVNVNQEDAEGEKACNTDSTPLVPKSLQQKTDETIVEKGHGQQKNKIIDDRRRRREGHKRHQKFLGTKGHVNGRADEKKDQKVEPMSEVESKKAETESHRVTNEMVNFFKGEKTHTAYYYGPYTLSKKNSYAKLPRS